MNLKNEINSLLLIAFLLILTCYSHAQKKELTIKDYGFQTNENLIPFKLPYGYEAVKTVTLNTKLYPNKKYKVRFLVTAVKSPEFNAYSYYFKVFPSNFINKYGIQDKGLSKSEDIIPVVSVPQFQDYEKKYLSFVISPDSTYTHLSIGLDKKGDDFSFMKKYVNITGIFVQPLSDKETDEDSDNYDRELIDKGETFTVNEGKVTILVYDHQRIDNDIVTIYLNDDKIVEKLTLKRKKKRFKVELQPGKNTIRLHAENLGKIPPNTVTIVIKHGDKEIKQVLNSDLDKSEYFTLIYYDALEDSGN